jgi:hypothetical protein
VINVLSKLDLRMVRSLMEARQARLRRTPLLAGADHERRTVRRWIGLQMVSLGHRLANEQPMQPARAR